MKVQSQTKVWNEKFKLKVKQGVEWKFKAEQRCGVKISKSNEGVDENFKVKKGMK